MIKAEYAGANKRENVGFPKMMLEETSGAIFLMIHESRGVVLNSGKQTTLLPVGATRYNLDVFELRDYEARLELSNE